MNKQQNNQFEIPTIQPNGIDGVVNLIEAADIVLSNIFYKSYYPKDVLKEFLKNEIKRVEFIQQFLSTKVVGDKIELREEEMIALEVIAISFGLVINLSTGSITKVADYPSQQTHQEVKPDENIENMDEMKCQCESDECVDYEGGFKDFMEILVEIGLLAKKEAHPTLRK